MHADDIPQTAQAFMDEHGVRDREKYTQLVQLMTRKTLLFMMEELARGEEGGGDAEDGEGDDADAALGEETKQGSPGRKVPTGLLPSSAPVPSVTPLPICRHIPKRVPHSSPPHSPNPGCVEDGIDSRGGGDAERSAGTLHERPAGRHTQEAPPVQR
jgi:hypothetical protein